MSARIGPGPLVALGALVAGILAGASAAPRVAGGTCIVGAIALLVAWWVEGPARVVVAALTLGLLGVGLSARAEAGLRSSSLTPLVERRVTVTLPGTLVADADGSGFVTTASVRVPVAGGHRTVLARATSNTASRLRVLHAGDRVTLTGRLAPLRPVGPDARARWRHVVARLDDADVVAFERPHGLFAVADGLRGFVLRGAGALPPEQQALLAGFLLGDTRDIPDDISAAYRDAGLSHLLAVSGANVAFVLALCGPLLRRLPLVGRTVMALVVILLFATMTRYEPSVLRASVMAAVAILAVAAGRPAARLRVLALGVIVCLLADPFLLHSVGFLLSCGASAGIVIASPAITARLPVPGLVREPLAVSFAAQLGVLPVLLTVFGSFPAITPLANLAAVPAAEIIGVYGFVASGIAAVVPPLGPLVQAPTAVLLTWVSAVARGGAAVPLVLDGRGTAACGAIGAAAASLACLRARRPVPDPASR